MAGKKLCYDHNGKRFESQTAMCKHHNVNMRTFRRRLYVKKLTIKESLSTDRRARDCEDHTGNKFSSYSEMCDFHNVRLNDFFKRRERGKSLEDCLKPMKKRENIMRDLQFNKDK